MKATEIKATDKNGNPLFLIIKDNRVLSSSPTPHSPADLKAGGYWQEITNTTDFRTLVEFAVSQGLEDHAITRIAKNPPRKLTQIERETVLMQLEGYYMIPQRLETKEQSFDEAKAELIRHLEKNIENAKLATFEMFSKMKKWN